MASEQTREYTTDEIRKMSHHEKQELEKRVQQGETVVKGGYGGKTLEAQMHLSDGRHKGGGARAEQMGREGYQEMGRKGGLSSMERSGQEAAEEKGIEIDESKYRTKSKD